MTESGGQVAGVSVHVPDLIPLAVASAFWPVLLGVVLISLGHRTRGG